jgi:hypothetical protein
MSVRVRKRQHICTRSFLLSQTIAVESIFARSDAVTFLYTSRPNSSVLSALGPKA